MKEKFIVYYRGEQVSYDHFENIIKPKRFESLKEAIEVSKEVLKKNERIEQASIEEVVLPKPAKVIPGNTEGAVIIWNQLNIAEKETSKIDFDIEYQSDEYEVEAKK